MYFLKFYTYHLDARGIIFSSAINSMLSISFPMLSSFVWNVFCIYISSSFGFDLHFYSYDWSVIKLLNCEDESCVDKIQKKYEMVLAKNETAKFDYLHSH